MYSSVLQSSWTLAVRGVIALLFGVVALFLPASALFALVIAFGAYAFVVGVVDLAAAITRRDREGRGWLAVEGAAGIIAGIITFVSPGITAMALIALVAIWALITGVTKIVSAIRLRKEIKGEWLLVLSGVVSIVLAALIVMTPIRTTLALVWALGIYAIAIGGMLIGLSFRVRNWEKRSSLEPPLQRAA